MNFSDARSLSCVAQADLRIKAVQAVLSGQKQKDVCRLFGISKFTVCRWVKHYREGGEKVLKASKRGRPRRRGALLPWQCAQIAKSVIDHHPEQLKLPYYLWTRDAVAELIRRRYGINLSVWTIGRYLRHWGFTPQKPVRRAFEQNPEAVKNWMEKEYPAIRKKARREKAEIHWCDEMGLRSDHAAGRTYGLKGCTPVVMGTGQRFRCNMISSITNRGKLRFMVSQKRFGAAVFLIFIKRLARQMNHPVFLIVDQHPMHRAKMVQNWLRQHKHQIKLFYLPPYSPELNPDEMLNQDVKSNALGRRRPRNQTELVNNVRGHLRRRQRQPALVKKYFNEKNVRYAAA